MFRVEYYEKDGKGFCGGSEPWFDGEYTDEEDANEAANDLIHAGMQNVKVVDLDESEFYKKIVALRIKYTNMLEKYKKETMGFNEESAGYYNGKQSMLESVIDDLDDVLKQEE